MTSKTQIRKLSMEELCIQQSILMFQINLTETRIHIVEQRRFPQSEVVQHSNPRIKFTTFLHHTHIFSTKLDKTIK